MKAISLWQPHASLVPGPKSLETRCWDTSYRGPLLICASKYGQPSANSRHLRSTCSLARLQILELLERPEFFEALKHLLSPDYLTEGKTPRMIAAAIYEQLPFGQAVAVCNLVATYPTESLTREQIGENLPFGDFSPGRFAWDLRDRKAIKEPFPVVGRQRLFEVDDRLLEGKELVKWAA